MRISLATLIPVALLLVAAACEDEPAALFGPPTEAICPEGSTLTYEGFGRPFMDAYCTRCHNSALVGADRNGAPNFHDFDILEGIRAIANHIDETAAAGPAAINESMPPDDPPPSRDERLQLGEWLACGAP